jgi:iron complex transport system permease protein
LDTGFIAVQSRAGFSNGSHGKSSLHYICHTMKKPGSASPKALYVFLFFIFFLAIFLFSAWLGTVEISLQTVLWSVLGKSDSNLANTLIWDLRIPRFLMGFLAGGCLAVAGQSMQILLRNPLADPYTMGWPMALVWASTWLFWDFCLAFFLPFISFLSGDFWVLLFPFLLF